ncbi:MAG: hypothetical protein GX493_04070, partial [Firmicutes bacterium]|nr:hypothetical protein [Bacillota bacterium]
PARRYARVLWNHGSGIYDLFPSKGGGTRGGLSGSQAVAIDWTDGDDALTTKEYAMALQAAAPATGKRIDLLHFDACDMAMVEVAAEIAVGLPVDYLVGSEAKVPGDGLDYRAVLSWLCDHPWAGGAELASFLVENYAETYASSWPEGVIGCVIHLTGEKWPLFLATVARLTAALSSTTDDGLWTAVQEAAQEAYYSDYYYPENRDLLDFVRLLREKTAGSFPAIAQTAAEIQDLLRPGGGLVVRTAATGPLAARDLGGLAVFLPTFSGWSAKYPDYSQLAFAVTTRWEGLVTRLASP